MAWASLAVLMGGILYRIPRGGPNREWWPKYLRFISYINEEIWALGTALAICAALSSWWPLITFPLLWLGEKPGYMKYVSTWRVDVWKLNFHGILMLNPLMGFIYEFFRERKVIIWQPFFDGWTAWAELVCGLTSTLMYLFLWKGILLII